MDTTCLVLFIVFLQYRFLGLHIKSKEAIPRTEVLEQPHITIIVKIDKKNKFKTNLSAKTRWMNLYPIKNSGLL
jgi:hypothetical protein